MKEFWPKWTLLNGLVAILCIAVIAAVLAPGLNGHHHSPQAACISNLKQLGTTQMIYATDHDERLPPFYTFEDQSREFVESLEPYKLRPHTLICPFSPESKGSNERKSLSYQHFPLVLRHASLNHLINLEKIDNPVEVPLMRDEILKVEKSPNGEQVTTNHASKPNYLVTLFMDSHVKVLPTIKSDRPPQITTEGRLIK